MVVSTGNITSRELLALFDKHLGAVLASFEHSRLVQLSDHALSVLHED